MAKAVCGEGIEYGDGVVCAAAVVELGVEDAVLKDSGWWEASKTRCALDMSPPLWL